jgi:hypothetical protein
MRKLKVGDKVELTEDGGVNHKGDIGIITQINSGCLAKVEVVNNGNFGNWSILEELKLIKTNKMRKLKVGDKVKINEIGLPGCVNKIGDIGVITEIDHLKHARVQVGDLLSEHNWSKLSDLELIKNKMNKHKKFIKDAYNGKTGLTMCSEWKEVIEETYPEFKPKTKLKVGEWYKKDNYLMVWNEGRDTYGFYEGSYGSDWSFDLSDLTPATEEEVKEALISQCKKLGIWEVPVKCLYGSSGKMSCFDIQFNDNRLWSTYGVVFEDGVFAKPLPIKKQMTVSQLEEELGYEIEIIK